MTPAVRAIEFPSPDKETRKQLFVLLRYEELSVVLVWLLLGEDEDRKWRMVRCRARGPLRL